MLAEVGADYEHIVVDLAKGEGQQAEYLALNPTGQIPTLVDGDFVLTESAAMVHYLAEKYGPALLGDGTPEARATQLRWELFILLNIDKSFVALAEKTWGKVVTEEAEAKATAILNRMLPILNAHLTANAYLAGSNFTLADVICRSSFMYADLAGFDLSAYGAINSWVERCSERPAFIQAMAK